jgi:hypothetical protein
VYNIVHEKINTFSPLQIKNKPRGGDLGHVFTLGSTDCAVANIALQYE